MRLTIYAIYKRFLYKLIKEFIKQRPTNVQQKTAFFQKNFEKKADFFDIYFYCLSTTFQYIMLSVMLAH